MKNETKDGAALLSYFEDNRADILQFMQWLVEQESMSREAEATARIARNLGDRLSEMGARVDLFSDLRFGATLRARFEHAGVPAPFRAPPLEDKQLLVVGHLDTVWPLGTLAARPFRIEEDRAYGPGIFDMKSGVTIAVFAMRALRDMGRSPQRPVTFLMTCDEETGSLFSREVIEEEGRASHAALIIEPPIPGGLLKTARKGVGEFELIVRGRSAHAGNDPRAGISAITELAHQILAVNAMNDYERGTTLNVGVVRGGILSNVIAAEARASIDMRFQTVEEGERITEAIRSLQPTLDGARLEVLGGINRQPLVRTKEVASLFEHARALAAEIGYDLQEGSVGGGSDGNLIAALGVGVLDGLGVDGAGAHAEHEHILISDIPRRATLLARLIETV
ncbi:MAG: M20 family metallopeptidase [Blastocatellia bacterium]|nr:M20 family metallopeptidase [Blastocatellia bacterium]